MILIFWLVLLSGCALGARVESIGSKPEHEAMVPEHSTNALMAQDLISAIVQILPPIETTIQVSAPSTDALAGQVAQAFVDAGYGIQKVSSDQGPHLLSVDIADKIGVDQALRRMRIGVGEMSISRAYALLSESAVRPASAFRLYGTRARIEIGATKYGAEDTAQSGTEDTQYTGPLALDEPLPTISLITPEVVQRVVDETSSAPAATSLNSSQLEVNNLFYSESTFGSVLDDYEQVSDLLVVFADDSIVLGDENKLLIDQFASRFVESYDVISVVGCSNGSTTLELGNVGLALGRAERVTEHLVGIGIPRERVLDEGCWAPEGGVKQFPGRGVVMELWRETL